MAAVDVDVDVDTDSSEAMLVRRRDAAVELLRRDLRAQVRASSETQRAIERRNGYTQGYLSQVLKGHITLSMRHVFGLLLALDIEPAEYFARLFPRSEDGENSTKEQLQALQVQIGTQEERVASRIREGQAATSRHFEAKIAWLERQMERLAQNASIPLEPKPIWPEDKTLPIDLEAPYPPIETG
ncbi:MAG: hypothetical protein AAF772_07895 [Acidobacteriota bacterium]